MFGLHYWCNCSDIQEVDGSNWVSNFSITKIFWASIYIYIQYKHLFLRDNLSMLRLFTAVGLGCCFFPFFFGLQFLQWRFPFFISGGAPFHTTFAPFPPAQLIASPIPTPIPGRVPPQFGVGPFPQLYVLSYPSPPVSPTGYYGPASPSHIAIVPPDVSSRLFKPSTERESVGLTSTLNKLFMLNVALYLKEI